MSERHLWKRLSSSRRANNIRKFAHKVYSRYHDQRMVSRLTFSACQVCGSTWTMTAGKDYFYYCRSHGGVENECLEMHYRK